MERLYSISYTANPRGRKMKENDEINSDLDLVQ
jgi:hypothetical protein